MVVYYNIAGRQIGSHHLSLGILSSLFGGIYLATRGGSAAKPATPPIKAESKDEENFIQDFLKQVDGGDKDKKSSH